MKTFPHSKQENVFCLPLFAVGLSSEADADPGDVCELVFNCFAGGGVTFGGVVEILIGGTEDIERFLRIECAWSVFNEAVKFGMCDAAPEFNKGCCVKAAYCAAAHINCPG